MHEPLPACRRSWSCFSRWALPAGMLLCPAPPQGLHSSSSLGSGRQRGRWPWSTALPGTAVERPLRCPSLVSGWKPQPSPARPRLRLSWRLWEDEDGAAAVARGPWLAGSRLAAPPRPGSEAGGAPGVSGAGRAAPTQAMRRSRGRCQWHPGSCRSRHSFLTLLECQRGLKRALGFSTDHKHLDSAQPACFPPRKVAPSPRCPHPAGPGLAPSGQQRCCHRRGAGGMRVRGAAGEQGEGTANWDNC